jgi:hypothetical protein
MNDDERGYREGRPLADIIPPDRRRWKAAALVVGGMVAGAVFLALTQHAFERRAAVAAPPRAPQILAFAAGTTDRTFDLVVAGSVVGIGLVQCDDQGRPLPNAARWGTMDHDDAEPAHSSRGLPGYGRGQLSVSEDGRVVNDALGGLPPLPDGYHRLALTPSTAGRPSRFEGDALFPANTNTCVTVIGEGHTIAKAGPVKVTDMPAREPPPPVPTVQGMPFDRGAAAASLGATNLSRCAKIAGKPESGRVEITFDPKGHPSMVAVIEGADVTSPASKCVAEEYKKQARVPPFGGAPVHVKKSFSLN